MGFKFKDQILGVVLLSFLAFSSGTMLFEHTHIINGEKIIHSHPFDSDTDHTHNESSLFVLGLISNCILAITAVIFAFQCFLIIIATYQVLSDKFRFISDKFYLHLRAPPTSYVIG